MEIPAGGAPAETKLILNLSTERFEQYFCDSVPVQVPVGTAEQYGKRRYEPTEGQPTESSMEPSPMVKPLNEKHELNCGALSHVRLNMLKQFIKDKGWTIDTTLRKQQLIEEVMRCLEPKTLSEDTDLVTKTLNDSCRGDSVLNTFYRQHFNTVDVADHLLSSCWTDRRIRGGGIRHITFRLIAAMFVNIYGIYKEANHLKAGSPGSYMDALVCGIIAARNHQSGGEKQKTK